MSYPITWDDEGSNTDVELMVYTLNIGHHNSTNGGQRKAWTTQLLPFVYRVGKNEKFYDVREYEGVTWSTGDDVDGWGGVMMWC